MATNLYIFLKIYTRTYRK